MALNEKLHPNPEQFSPERYLVKNPPLDPRFYLFGIGRRSVKQEYVEHGQAVLITSARRTCPGLPLAENVFLAVMLTLLATVDIVAPNDADGNEAIPEVETTGNIAKYARWSSRLSFIRMHLMSFFAPIFRLLLSCLILQCPSSL